LQRKHVVVTDAGSGIGRAIALRPARDCATLTLLARGRTGWTRRRRRSRGARASRAATFAPRGVQVNAICPGWVDTDMAWQGLDAAAAEIGGTRQGAYCDAMKHVPLGRMSEPEDIAGAVAWLLSPDARGVAGQAIDQNGGAWTG